MKDSFNHGSLSFMYNKNGEVFKTAKKIIESSPYLLDDADISEQFTKVFTKTAFKNSYDFFLKYAKPCFVILNYKVYSITTPIGVQFIIFDNNEKEKSTKCIYYMYIAYNWSRNKLFNTNTSKGIYVSRVWKSSSSDIPSGFTVKFLSIAYLLIKHDYIVNDPGQTLAFTKVFTRFAKQFIKKNRVFGYSSSNRSMRFIVPLQTESQLVDFSKATTKSTLASSYKGFFILSKPSNLKKSIYDNVPIIAYDAMIANHLLENESYDQDLLDELRLHKYIQ